MMCVLVINSEGPVSSHRKVCCVTDSSVDLSRGEALEDETAFYINLKVTPQPLDKSKNNCLLSGQAAAEEETHSSNSCVFQLWQMEQHILW